ncbi:40S ribosomal protein SA [Camelus dromedarius]|uniref:40S ribosomal protein SA n=1 Tax=Camelus dromedarius TaxID=9838 RepID=A0A5N4C135_CAMDR|nr:40S ribosomal protein SA [Camelus dromedarius]
MNEEDVLQFLAAETYSGGTNLDFQMEQYIYKKKSDGIYSINMKRTLKKFLLAACATVATENPAISAMSFRNTGQPAVLKLVAASGAISIAGHVTPESFTNQIQAAFREPRLPMRDPEETEKKEQATAENFVRKEEFQGEWTSLALEFPATQLEVADWSEGTRVPSVPSQRFCSEV